MLSRITLLGSVTSFVVLVVACAAKSDHPPASETSSGNVVGGGGGSSSGVLADGGLADGGTCNALSITGTAIIAQQQIAEAAPVPVGGTILDGTYFLTKDTIFTGPGGTTAATGVTTQEVQAFSATNFEILTQPAAPSPSTDASGTFAISSVTNEAGTSSGFTLTITIACPTPTSVVRNYSVVNATLLEFVGPNEVLTYTLL
jgi:hypothetical protein